MSGAVPIPLHTPLGLHMGDFTLTNYRYNRITTAGTTERWWLEAVMPHVLTKPTLVLKVRVTFHK
jgi:hypothetical protein